jgi:hypothetical protein
MHGSLLLRNHISIKIQVLLWNLNISNIVILYCNLISVSVSFSFLPTVLWDEAKSCVFTLVEFLVCNKLCFLLHLNNYITHASLLTCRLHFRGFLCIFVYLIYSTIIKFFLLPASYQLHTYVQFISQIVFVTLSMSSISQYINVYIITNWSSNYTTSVLWDPKN